jgi:hypothetical protein
MPKRQGQRGSDYYSDTGRQNYVYDAGWDPIGGDAGNPPPADLEEYNEILADIPVVNLLGGADAKNRHDAEVAAQRNREYWVDLSRGAPSVDQLTPDLYLEGTEDEYGDMLGGPSELTDLRASEDQMRALRNMQQLYDQGGYTEADRAASQENAIRQGQMLRGSQQAALQQMQARGMAGGGSELGARLAGSQQYAMGNAMGDAQVQQVAMARALQALQGSASMSNTMQEQEYARRSALDAFNQQNMDWRRGRENRNTDWMNQGGQNRANAYQTAYTNRERAVAGATNQYSTDAATRNSLNDSEKETGENIVTAIGSLFE